jgi:demethylmenaquinone methyltransferase / 2-methoxy-6-polyprenyl-1,4-benzoquinol methylase
MTSADPDKYADDSRAKHFGFKPVSEDEKTRLVYSVFEKVADRYDLMNDLMTVGLHRAWKQAMVDKLGPPRNDRPWHLIDVAGGTADIAFRALDRAGANAQVTVCDINDHMLEVGRTRAEEQGYTERTEFICGDAETLPFPDRHFDAYSIALGIRNVTRMQNALRDAYRVLKPGGRFVVLEMSHMVTPELQQVYDFLSFNAIPPIGKAVTGDAGPYQYLVESTRQFPKPDVFKAMIEDAGFENVQYQSLSGGIVALHWGWRI